MLYAASLAPLTPPNRYFAKKLASGGKDEWGADKPSSPLQEPSNPNRPAEGKPGSKSRSATARAHDERGANADRGRRGTGNYVNSSTFGLWNGVKRTGSKLAGGVFGATGEEAKDDDARSERSNRSSKGGSTEYQWKPMSKNSREYFKEILSTQASERNERHDALARGRRNSTGSNRSSGSKGSIEGAERPTWKSLKSNSRE